MSKKYLITQAFSFKENLLYWNTQKPSPNSVTLIWDTLFLPIMLSARKSGSFFAAFLLAATDVSDVLCFTSFYNERVGVDFDYQ